MRQPSEPALHELSLCRPEVLAVTWTSGHAFQEHCALPAQAWGTAVSLGLKRSALRALLCAPVGLRHCSAPGPNAGPPGALTDLHRRAAVLPQFFQELLSDLGAWL